MATEKHIDGRDAARMAEENDKRRPIAPSIQYLAVRCS